MEVADVEQRLETSLETGLSSREAATRQARFGPNTLREAKPRSSWLILGAQFADVMIIVLLVAAIVAGLLGEPEDTAAILAIVILNAIIGFVQEYRAQRALALLRQLSAHRARVIRDGKVGSIPTMELVPGDIVIIEAGNSIPADLRVGEAIQLRIDEAMLTGESVPVEKHLGPVDSNQHLVLGDRKSMAFKGTTVSYGRGRGIVVATGMGTELGQIAELLEKRVEVKTPLQRRLAQLGRYLAIAALAICAVIFVVGVQRGEPVVRMFLTAVSLAVAAIPEALPAVVTITLALGARKMLRARTLVRRLPAVETLGSVTYVCSDKTGTLTENKMRLTSVYAAGARTASIENHGGEPWNMLYTALALSNDAARDSQGKTTGDPTEVALLEAAAAAGFDKLNLVGRLPRAREFAFDSNRKRMTTVHRFTDGFLLFAKGAPEAILSRCVATLGPEGEQPINAAKIASVADQMASEGLRVLAVAYRKLKQVDSNLTETSAESSLILLGLVGLIDPPRAEAREAVRICQHAGITPVMITRDHPATARAIAGSLGIATPEAQVVNGADLARMTPEELDSHVQRVRVYARVDPAQKVRIVEALQKRGEFVAMTGDGVNDAPALKLADIGVAMGRGGTDVARDAADLVLLDDNFATIVAAVKEGRHIFDNIRKFVKFILASNSAEVWTIFLAPLLGLPVPLLPIHILWTNLVTDGLPGLALAVEPAEANVMTRPPRPPKESLFAHGLWQQMIWVGLMIAGLSLSSQAYAIRVGSEHWQTIVFSVLTLSQMANVMAVRSETESLFRIGLFSNLPLLGAVLVTVGLQMLVIYLPAFQKIFKTAALSATELVFILLLCSLVFFAVEFEKWMVRRGWLYGPMRAL